MKIFKLIKLGTKNLSSHKKQNFITVIITSALFSIIFAAFIIPQGLENVFLSAANTSIQSENILLTTTTTEQIDHLSNEKLTNQKISKYNGRLIGWLDIREKDGMQYIIIDESILKDYYDKNIQTYNLSKLITLNDANAIMNPLDYQNIMTSYDLDLSKINNLKSSIIGTINNQEYIADIISFSGHNSYSFSEQQTDFNILNFFTNISNNSFEQGMYINNNSEEIKTLIQDTTTFQVLPIISFSTLDDAYDFYIHESCNITRKCNNYSIHELFNNKLAIHDNFVNIKKNTDIFLKNILLVVALIIIIFTFVKIINQDKQLIALYYSLGASKFDIAVIYLVYLLELCLITILVSIGIALIIALILTASNKDALLSILLTHFLNAQATTPTLLIGFNFDIIKIILIIFTIAPISILLTLDQLSTSNIFKRLKSF